MKITYPHQKISWRKINKQKHILFSMNVFAVMCCDTEGYRSAGNQELRYPRVFQAVSMFSLLAYTFLNCFTQRHSWGRLSYTRITMTWQRENGCLSIDIYWYVLVYGSWWQPFKVFSSMIFGLAEKLSLWDGSTPLQWHTYLDTLWGNTKGTYHHPQ